MSARRSCHAPPYWYNPTHPRRLHSSQMPPQLPWVPCYCSTSKTPGTHSPSSQRSHFCPTEVQRIRSRAACHLRGRKAFRHMLEGAISPSSQTTSPSPTPSSKRGTNAHRGSSTIWTLSPSSRQISSTILDRTTLSPTSLASSPSLCHFHTTHWPQHRTVKTSSEHTVVWPGVQDSRTWARACQPCQHSKVSRHIVTALGEFSPPAARFLHVHIGLVGPLTISAGYTYCHNAVERLTRWPEVIPIPDISIAPWLALY
jgi:hypothetical protein